jgi:hypothetical protein
MSALRRLWGLSGHRSASSIDQQYSKYLDDAVRAAEENRRREAERQRLLRQAQEQAAMVQADEERKRQQVQAELKRRRQIAVPKINPELTKNQAGRQPLTNDFAPKNGKSRWPFGHLGWMIGRPKSFNRLPLPGNVLFHFGNVPIDLRKVLLFQIAVHAGGLGAIARNPSSDPAPARCSAPSAGCGRGPFFVAQKSQVEILIVVTETASCIPEFRCCGGNPLFRIPQTWPRFRRGLFFASVSRLLPLATP